MTIIGLVAVVLMILGGFLMIYIDLNFENSANLIKRLFIYTGIIGFLLTTFFAFFLLSKISQPLLNLKRAADLLARGNYDQKIEIHPSDDEIGELSKTFHVMAERLEQTVRELKHEKEHLHSVLRSMKDAVITYDAKGKILLINPPGQALIEEWSTLNWVDNKIDSDKSNLKNDVPEPLETLFSDVVHGAKELTTNLHVKKGIWSVVMTPLYDQDMKAVRGAVAVMRDVTEEERLNKFRQDFVANVSHELRTPISMLQGYSEALVDGIVTNEEERQELVQILYEESQRMGRLVEDLLELSRMESGFHEMACDEVDLNFLSKRMARKFTALAADKGIQLSTDVQDEPLIAECADEDRLEQVFTNLIDNAIRHSDHGTVVGIHTRKSIENGTEYALIQIKDQGEGIPAEDLPFIFDRFYKADKARTRGAASGTGLGLSIVNNIIEAHHGTIEVLSRLDQGTTFTFKIPLKSPNFSKKA